MKVKTTNNEGLAGQLLTVLKKKKTIAIIVVVIAFFIISHLFVSAYRETIRERQIESVAKVTFKNKQFKNVKNADINTILSSKEPVVLGIINPTNNKGYDELEKMFNEAKSIEGLPEIVYIYQPIYGNQKSVDNLKLDKKNNFLLIENGKESKRYAFDTLKNGASELVDEVNLMINPKIPQKKPKRVEKKDELDFNPNPSDGTHTSEVEFE
ncbi:MULTISPECIES: hypothetical protein [Vagococcus]|uniref:Uncharacterized protein n=1 Tax=Vagococcus fluvialis bH819 TaxID=1255619 RepID=A0A1X6WNB2_9ENTE|nr:MULTISPECIES: hypothetical protein [Vagococcus]SLM85814.1 hypothetical protein FM121_06915 [Vagococcus fluvialis bH819]HCM90236.1 hypothetical protein [Vagococcus sp.]